jgi:hypothetical protein
MIIKMGYDTQFNGEIKISSEECKLYIKNYLLREYDGDGDWDGLNDSSFDDETNILTIDEDWKNYEDEMQFVLFKIIKLDPKAKGTIEAKGEESDDFWKIVIKEGKLFEQKGKIVYSEGKEWRDADFDEDDLKEIKETILPFKSIIYCDKCKNKIDFKVFDFRKRGYYEEIIKNTKFKFLCDKCYKEVKKPLAEKKKIESDLSSINKELEGFKK